MSRMLALGAVLVPGCTSLTVPETSAASQRTPPAGASATGQGSGTATAGESEPPAPPDSGEPADGEYGGEDEYCGCDPEKSVAVDEPVSAGFSAQDALSRLAMLSVEFRWAHAPEAATTLSVVPGATLGTIWEIPGDECCSPCSFLYVPCPDGLETVAELEIRTADGLLAETVPAEFSAYDDGSRVRDGFVATVAASQIQGSLRDHLAPEVTEVTIDLGRSSSDDGVRWNTYLRVMGGEEVLAESGR